MAEPAQPRPSFIRRLWRWMRWPLLLLVLALVTFGIFHRPIILWALNRFAPDAAKSAGLALRMKADGSLWKDFSITALEASSDDQKMPLRSLKLGELSLKYDPSPAWAGDYFRIPKGITLHDVDATLDLRHPSPPSTAPSKPTDKQAIIDMVKKIVWPDIDLQNINVTVLLPDATLKITDLDLILPAGKQGTLHIARVEHPALTQYPLQDITAKLAIHGAKLSIDEFKLPPQIEIEHLTADAAEFGKGKIAATTAIRSGAATIALDAKADISGASPIVDATIDIAGIDQNEVGRWLKEAPVWQAKLNKLHITAKGDVMKPQSLRATVSMNATSLGFQAYRGDDVTVEASLANGKLDLSKLSASAGGNRIEVTTQIDAPAEWPGFAKAPLKLNWKLTAPTLQSIAGLPMKVSGSVSGDGAVRLAEQGLQDFEAHVIANGVAVDQHKLRSLDAKAKGDLKLITFDAHAAADAGDGKLDAKGSIGLEAGSASHAEWKVIVPKPDELTKSLGVAWPADVGIGEVKTDGALDFDLAKLKAKDFDHAKGKGSLSVEQPSWKSAPCEHVTAAWKLEGGKATVSALDVKLPGDNALHLEAAMALAGEQAFDASLSLQTKDLAALRAWLDAASVKQLQSGSVVLNWKGKGKLQPALGLSGDASLKVDALRYETLPDAAQLDTTFTHDLEGANFQSLVAKLGPWSASLRGLVSKTGIDLKGIEASHEAKKLITGSILVPLDLASKPLPLDQNKPIHIRIDTTEKHQIADLAKIAKATLPPDLAGVISATIQLDGTLPKLQSRIEINAEELKLPKVPGNDPGSVSLLMTLNDGALNVDTKASVKPLEPLTAHVSAKVDVPALIADSSLAMNTPFEASVKLNQPTLDFLKPMVPMLDELKGSILIDAQADGTAKAPHVHGAIVIDVPSVIPHEPDLPFVKDLKARITADGTTIKVESLHALAAGGELDLTASCDLKDTAQPAFDVSVKARDLIVMRNEMMSLRTDADLRCQGIPTRAVFTGSIGLTRGRVFQEVDFLPLNKMMNDLPPLPDQKASKPSKDPSASPLPPMLKDWTFDVAVKTKDDIRLLGNIMNGGVKIDLGIAGSGAAPQVKGEVTMQQARLNLPFSTLRIRKGVVSFAPDKPLVPTLELLAESTVDAYEINLRGYGAVTDPKIHFTSTPPLPEGEIATLLATGSTTSGLKSAGSDTAGRALLLVVREAYRRMFASKNKPKKAGEEEDESRFTVQERSENGSLGGVTGIYEFSRKMKIVGSTNKDGGFRAMFHYLFRFD